MSKRSDQEVTMRLHRRRPGLYAVGASPLLIRRDDGERLPWAVYGTEVEGIVRIPGEWAFATLKEARARAFDYARERGWAP